MANFEGGSVYIENGEHILILMSKFVENDSNLISGGAIYVCQNSSSVLISNTVFSSNFAYKNGGAIAF